jgi:Zn-finger nucleic acid-binding protein
MSRTHQGNKRGVGVELKYCEHCGGLWVRERGAGEVYCEKCQPKVAELPVPKKRPGRIMLPEQKCSVAQRYRVEVVEESEDLEAVGGVA